MSSEPQWLTVKEAAEKAGVTTQAIYKKLKTNELQTKKENGRTYVDWQEVANWTQPVANENATDIVELLKSQIESHQQTVNLLQTQLTEKDEQIKHLHLILAQSQDNMKRTQLALEASENELQIERSADSWWTRIFGRKAKVAMTRS
jgi:predicted DNA-binding protein YlxM (UPF0122 family)